MKKCLVLFFVAMLLVPATASGETFDPYGEKEKDPGHFLSVVFSPIHLIFPVFEARVEYAVMKQLGISLLAGGGKVTIEDEVFNRDVDVTVWEIGAQAEYYVVGDFDHGMQLGAELIYMGANAEEEETDTKATGQGLSIGVFAGYKFVASFGLTVNIQGGVQYITAQAEAENSDSSDDESTWGPLLNLDLGWSF